MFDVMLPNWVDRLPLEGGAVAAVEGVLGGVLDGGHDVVVVVIEGNNPAKDEEATVSFVRTDAR